jgi:hypothetical protein
MTGIFEDALEAPKAQLENRQLTASPTHKSTGQLLQQPLPFFK